MNRYEKFLAKEARRAEYVRRNLRPGMWLHLKDWEKNLFLLPYQEVGLIPNERLEYIRRQLSRGDAYVVISSVGDDYKVTTRSSPPRMGHKNIRRLWEEAYEQV